MKHLLALFAMPPELRRAALLALYQAPLA